MTRPWIAVLAAVALGVTACTGADKPSTDRRGANAPLNRDAKTLVVAVDSILADFDPASSYLVNAAVIFRGPYEGLIKLKGDSPTEVEPVLAERSEHNADSSVWTFHLRPNVKFTDGAPLDAAAVKANYVRLRDWSWAPTSSSDRSCPTRRSRYPSSTR